MSVVGAWEVGVAVLTSKTAMLLLHFAQSRHTTVRFAGASLPYVNKYWYLGVTVVER